MPENQSAKVKETQLAGPRTFLAGKTWAQGKFAEDEIINEVLELVRQNKHPKPSEDFYNKVEETANALALSIVRYSRSEWGNDYWYAVHDLAALSNWLEYYEKKFKFGRHFSLT